MAWFMFWNCYAVNGLWVGNNRSRIWIRRQGRRLRFPFRMVPCYSQWTLRRLAGSVFWTKQNFWCLRLSGDVSRKSSKWCCEYLYSTTSAIYLLIFYLKLFFFPTNPACFHFLWRQTKPFVQWAAMEYVLRFRHYSKCHKKQKCLVFFLNTWNIVIIVN